MIILSEGVVTVRTESGFNTFYPVFLEQDLREKHYFEVEVIDVARRDFTVGVATSDLRHTSDKEESSNSLCVYAKGFLFSDGKQQKLIFKPVSGDRLAVIRTANEIEWLKNGQSLCKTSIPARLINKMLFPVCWIFSDDDPDKISKLRFL